ncbi:MAG: four helix bundle protein [Flammeovirgaceae bacterium]|nr:MAG: four helix bundle protein [Flammeovirgaceae bacterium]
MRNYTENIIVKMTFEFALEIMEFSEILREKKRFAFADQVLRSGCSIGANVREAQGAESKADFIHKMKIAFKEAEETEYWLELCDFGRSYPKPGILLNKIEGILKVLNKIISSSKKSNGKGRIKELAN